MKKHMVEVTYKFEIKYKHKQHLIDLLHDLENSPIIERGGAGMVDGTAYSYNCVIKGKGKIT